MNFKLSLVVLATSLVLVLLASLASAGFSDGETCNHASKSHCKYCCVTENGYTGSEWKKFGGSKGKTCVCTAPSGTKTPAHRNDYEPEWTPYVPKDPRFIDY